MYFAKYLVNKTNMKIYKMFKYLYTMTTCNTHILTNNVFFLSEPYMWHFDPTTLNTIYHYHLLVSINDACLFLSEEPFVCLLPYYMNTKKDWNC